MIAADYVCTRKRTNYGIKTVGVSARAWAEISDCPRLEQALLKGSLIGRDIQIVTVVYKRLYVVKDSSRFPTGVV